MTSHPQIAPYGSWRSPITADLIVQRSIRLGEIQWDGSDLYWSELRPQEAGRSVIVRYRAGTIADVTPPPFNVRSRVHEYGGGAYVVDQGTVYFANFADQRWYRQSPGQDPEPITPERDYRYADLVVDRSRQRLICVREDHTATDHEAINTVVAIALAGDDTGGQILASGADFYAAPRLSPDGTQLAWLSWNHPHMPWDSTTLWVAPVQADSSLGTPRAIAGGEEESIFQPAWSLTGDLYFISDRTDWWNLYRWDGQTVEPVYPLNAEFGLPQWVFGLTTYGFESEHRMICTYQADGVQTFARLNLNTNQLTELTTPYAQISGIQIHNGVAALIGSSATLPSCLVRLDLKTEELEELRTSNDLELDPGYLSQPQAIAFPTVGDREAYGIYYPPKNRDYQAPPGELPPLLVKSHGGPTAATTPSFNLSIQFWTSRGFAVLDVNYGGSTGYGRTYRERLRGQWGIVDIDDCCQGALSLVAQHQVDRDRLAIAGGSAGGYTTLGALTFRQVFKAGASYYGVSDMIALAAETHKFESRYLDGLVGPYPAAHDRYQARSPLYHAEQLACPVIFLQGAEDKIVPPNQAERMVEMLKQKGIPVAYLLFAGEQHGFRQAANIQRSLEAELYFYAQIFGFELADKIAPIAIFNLPQTQT